MKETNKGLKWTVRVCMGIHFRSGVQGIIYEAVKLSQYLWAKD